MSPICSWYFFTANIFFKLVRCCMWATGWVALLYNKMGFKGLCGKETKLSLIVPKRPSKKMMLYIFQIRKSIQLWAPAREPNDRFKQVLFPVKPTDKEIEIKEKQCNFIMIIWECMFFSWQGKTFLNLGWKVFTHLSYSRDCNCGLSFNPDFKEFSW